MEGIYLKVGCFIFTTSFVYPLVSNAASDADLQREVALLSQQVQQLEQTVAELKFVH